MYKMCNWINNMGHVFIRKWHWVLDKKNNNYTKAQKKIPIKI